MTEKRQIKIKDIFAALGIAGRKSFGDLDQHFGVAESGHGAVSSPRELLRQIKAPATCEDADPAMLSFEGAAAQAGQLVHTRTILMLEHYDRMKGVDHLIDGVDRQIHRRGERKILQGDRNGAS